MRRFIFLITICFLACLAILTRFPPVQLEPLRVGVYHAPPFALETENGWAGVTMSTIGYGDKVPVTVGGRIVALIWMLVAMAVTAALTASLTSVLALGPNLSATQFPDDLRTMNVGSVADSESANFLREERIQFQSFSELQAAWRR